MERSKQFQSAFQSNAQAFNEKIQETHQDLEMKERQLSEIKQRNRDLENECSRMREELSLAT